MFRRSGAKFHARASGRTKGRLYYGEMGRAFDGSYAEYVLLPNEQIYPVHTDLDWTTLAAIPETYYTAFGSLQQLRIAPQDRVLVRDAGSGVGVAFAQLLKAQFPHIVLHGLTRNPAKAARCAGGWI